MQEEKSSFLVFEDEVEEAIEEDIPLSVTVGKPEGFFRVLPPEKTSLALVATDKDTLYYPATQAVKDTLVDHIESYRPVVWVQLSDKKIGVWFVKNLSNTWSDSANNISRKAITEWIRLLKWREKDDKYRYAVARNITSEPSFGEYSWREIVEAAFDGKVIDTVDHPVVNSLLGIESEEPF